VVVATVAAVLAASAVGLTWSSSHAAFAETRRFEIQSASVVGSPSGASLSPAVRVDAPDPPTLVAPVAAPVNRSTCRRDLDGPVWTITIPDISYACPV
jgi:hypothetical protein